MYDRQAIHTHQSTQAGATQQQARPQDRQSLLGNQAMLARMNEGGGEEQEETHGAGEECACGGTKTGKTSKVERPGTDDRYGPDIDLEAEYDLWMDYPEDLLDAEMEQVEEYNHAFDGINQTERDDIDTRFARREANLDAEADGWLMPGQVADRTTPEWQAERDRLASQRADMWGPMATGTWSGFEGDLEYRGFSSNPQGATWLTPSFTMADAFGAQYDNPDAQSDADYQVPIKGYSLYNDQNGKVTSTAMYGYALGPEPQVPSLRWQVHKVVKWCPDFEARGGGLKFKKGSDGRSVTSSNGRQKNLRGPKRKPKITGYHECVSWVRRDSKGKLADKPMQHGQRQADTFLETKRQDAEKMKAYHQERLEYIDVMSRGPGTD